MKTKALLIAALIGVAGLSSAQAGVHFGFSFGLPAPIVVAPAPVVVAPAPVVVTAPVPEVVAAPTATVVAAPAYPYAYPGYTYAPGYWSAGVGGRVWVHGGWYYRGHWAGGTWHGGWHRW